MACSPESFEAVFAALVAEIEALDLPSIKQASIASLLDRVKHAALQRCGVQGETSPLAEGSQQASMRFPAQSEARILPTLHPRPPDKKISTASTPKWGADQTRSGAAAIDRAPSGQSSGGGGGGGPLNLGQVIAATLYLAVEGLLARTQAERMSLYLTNNKTGEVQLSVNAGVGMPRPSRFASPPSAASVLGAVIATGIAANLTSVSLEDVAECPGPTRARNALIFPIRDVPPRTGCIGALIAVNHLRGAHPFTVDHERILHSALPSIAYVARQYPVDFNVFVFDPSLLHRIIPLQPAPSAVFALPHGWAVKTTQLVYHRDESIKHLRREVLKEGAEEIAEESAADQLRSVQDHVATMESCWHSTMAQVMDLERQVRQKQALISDAQELLHRKQKKLDLLKDIICEQLEASGQPPTMMMTHGAAATGKDDDP